MAQGTEQGHGSDPHREDHQPPRRPRGLAGRDRGRHDRRPRRARLRRSQRRQEPAGDRPRHRRPGQDGLHLRLQPGRKRPGLRRQPADLPGLRRGGRYPRAGHHPGHRHPPRHRERVGGSRRHLREHGLPREHPRRRRRLRPGDGRPGHRRGLGVRARFGSRCRRPVQVVLKGVPGPHATPKDIVLAHGPASSAPTGCWATPPRYTAPPSTTWAWPAASRSPAWRPRWAASSPCSPRTGRCSRTAAPRAA